MTNNTAIVVTSISAPNRSLEMLAAGARTNACSFLVMGDTKSPAKFHLDGCDFYDVDRQRNTGLSYAELCPTRSYARKNIGYLIAMASGAQQIVETDDDNLPRDAFWSDRNLHVQAPRVVSSGWLNVYRYFSEATIWPRGLPLDAVLGPLPDYPSLPNESVECPIQQGLADGDPDVDAIYRLLLPLPQNFRADRKVVLSQASWCPFNSQNTTWFPQAYALMYLPAHCSFRMTDIWRSFIAQRIAWASGWSILFHEPTVWQDRNEHNLMRDFTDEVPGYLNNRLIGAALDSLNLKAGDDAIPSNLRACYGTMVDNGWIGEEELPLLDAWLRDLGNLSHS